MDEDLELALENGEVPSREMYEAYIKDEVNSRPRSKVNSRPQTHPANSQASDSSDSSDNSDNEGERDPTSLKRRRIEAVCVSHGIHLSDVPL